MSKHQLSNRAKAKFKRSFVAALGRNLGRTFQITEDEYGDDIADTLRDWTGSPKDSDEEEKLFETKPV